MCGGRCSESIGILGTFDDRGKLWRRTMEAWRERHACPRREKSG